MKTKQITARSLNKLIQAAMALTFAVSSQLAGNLAYAGAGWGDNTDLAGNPVKVKTYYANSPSGFRPDPGGYVNGQMVNVNGGQPIDTGMPMRKFVDTLPTINILPGIADLPALSPSASAGRNQNGQYMPLGFPAKWINMNGEPTADDYYELAAVEYEEKLHSDLPSGGPNVQNPNLKKKGTRLRGYVQIEPIPDPNYPNYKQVTAPICKGSPGYSGQDPIGGGATALMGLNVFCSKHIALTYLNGDPIKDQYGNQVYGMDEPHYVGPIVVAIKGVPVRARFHNFLPCGANNRFVTTNAAGGAGFAAGGDPELFIPVDRTITGAGDTWGGNSGFLAPGAGPDVLTDNRTAVHWHGGDSPWISDGTPHQWFAPACEKAYTQGLGKGASTQDVPDMPPAGDGAVTLYWPVDLTARLMWFHEHVSGLTRLNAYVVMAAGMVVLDPSELCLMGAAGVGVPLPALAGAGVPNACALAGVFAGAIPGVATYDPKNSNPATATLKYRNYQKLIAGEIRIPFEMIPLVVQDKTLVPKDADPWQTGANFDPVAWDNYSQDSAWNTDVNHNRVDKWGRYGDLYFAHVYETNQDPNSFDGTNPAGRWDWAPWFWPVFPAQYSLPSGHWGDVTTTPESFMDSAMVNGTFYPTLTVDPKAYRFRILSAGNDRVLNMNFFQAVDKNNMVCDENAPAGSTNATASPVPPDIMSFNGVPYPGAQAPATCTEVRMVPSAMPINDPVALAKWPARWPADGRDGGVPDPSTAGPDIVVIGTEAGFIPHPTAIPAQPIVFEVNRRSVTVLNMINHGMLLAPGERADVIVDFSKFAGQTLILYNDAPAPAPAFDPRIDYYTGNPDYSGSGGWLSTQAGYGPNTRTLMQVKVRNTTPAPEWLPSAAAFEDPGNANPTPSGGIPMDALCPVSTVNPKAIPDNFRTDPANPYHLSQAEWDKARIAFCKFDDVMAAYYGLEQEPPLIPEEEYNKAFETNDGTNYARIFTGSGAQPFYNYTPTIAGQSVTAVSLTGTGTGYRKAPMVSFIGATSGTPAQAVAVVDNSYGISNIATHKLISATAVVAGTSYVIDTLGTSNLGTSNFALCGATGNTRGEVFKATKACTGTGLVGPVLSATSMVTGTSYIIDSVCTAPAGSTPAAAATFCKPPVLANAAAVPPIAAVPNPNYSDFSTCGGAAGRNSPGETFVAAVPANTAAGSPLLTNPCSGTGTVHHVPTYKLSSVNLISGGSGYSSAPQVRFDVVDGGTGAQADVLMTATKKLVVHNVAIQELFEPFYGRMNATLALELPFTTVNIATTIPMNYVDPQTEEISSEEVQVWKITHNGVDTHPVHFHMVDVQVLNRIGWDGTVKSISPHEYGWKETVLMHPLEDILVAMRPKLILAPFSVPQSVRRFDPTLPLGSTVSFTNGYQIFRGNGTAVTTNAVANYDNEYVWHCHILGHEENDFMRPFILHPIPQDQAAIPGFNDKVQAAATRNLNAQLGNIGASFPTMPANLVRPVPEAPQNLTINPIGVTTATLTWNDTTPPAVCMLPGGCPHPAVIALFQADGTGVATSNVSVVPSPAIVAPGLAQPLQTPGTWPTSLNNLPTKGHIQNENNFRVQKLCAAIGVAPCLAAGWNDVFTTRANVTSWTDTAWKSGDQYRVIANNCILTNGPAGGVGGYGANNGVANNGVPLGGGAANANGINGYTQCTAPALGVIPLAPPAAGAAPLPTDVMSSTMNSNNQSQLLAGASYYGDSAPSTPASVDSAILPTPTSLAALINVDNANTAPLPYDVSVTLNWNGTALAVGTSYKVEVSTHGMAGPFKLLGTVAAAPTMTYRTAARIGATPPAIAPGFKYTFRVTAQQTVTAPAAGTAPTVSSSPLKVDVDLLPKPAPLAPTNMVTIIDSATKVLVSWKDNANNETGYQIEHSVGGKSYTGFTSTAPEKLLFNTVTYPASEAAKSTVVYRVSAYIDNQYGMAPSYSAALISGTVSVAAPATPTNLTVATTSTNSQVDLSWDDNAGNENAYVLEFSTNGVTWKSLPKIDMTPGHVGRVSYTDKTVTAGLIYQYRVSAVNGAGSSKPSNTATIKLLPPVAPSLMTAVAPAIVGANYGTPGIASLSWTDNSDNETAFEIVVSNDGVNYRLLATVARNQTDTIALGGRVGYNDTTVVAGINSYYQVRAVNVFGKSSGFGATEVGLPFPPAAPTGMVMSIISPTQVMTTWKDNANDETSYMIENSSDGSTWTTLSNWPRTNAESVSAGGLVAYVANVTVDSHIFRVSAVKTNIYGSSPSVPLLSIIPPKGPSAIGTFVLNPKAVYVSWTDNSDNETGFRVEVSTDGGKKFTRMPDVISTAQQSAAVGVNPYAIVPVTPGSNNIIRVSSFRDEGPLGLAYSAPVTSFNVAVPRK